MSDRFTEVLTELNPDLIMTDVHLLEAADSVAKARRKSGLHTATIYDAREFTRGLASEDRRVLEGYPLLESEYIREVSAVVTVNDQIADFLESEFSIDRPLIIPNSPYLNLPEDGPKLTVREEIGLSSDVPLLVYGGGLNHARGVHNVVAALPFMPDVHLAISARAESSYTKELQRQAKSLQVSDRVHFVPYAPPHEVAEYQKTADAAIIPLLGVQNHQLAAPNKYYEAIQARLPIITSDMRWLSEQVTKLGIGEVYPAEDVEALAKTARKVLNNLEQYRSRLTPELVAQHSFEHYEPSLRELAVSTVPAATRDALKVEDIAHLEAARTDMLHNRVMLADSDIFLPRPWLFIGSQNFAGQGRFWGDALMRTDSRLVVETMRLEEDSPHHFTQDRFISQFDWLSPYRQRYFAGHLRKRVTHMLIEGGRPMIGPAYGQNFADEADLVEHFGVKTMLVFHGSDVRDPILHRELEPYSPYADLPDDEIEQLRSDPVGMAQLAMESDSPKFVTSLELLDYVPDATWLPTAVDTDSWAPDSAESRYRKPVLARMSAQDDSEEAERLEERLAKFADRVELRVIEPGPEDEVRQALSQADLFLDQFSIGDYSFAAVRAMALGKPVIGHVSERVLKRLPEEVPIVNTTFDQLEDTLSQLLNRREDWADLGRKARSYVTSWHDGRVSTGILADAMGLRS